jgi:tubby-related protein 1
MSSKEGMLVDYRLGHTNKIMSLVNRQPKWNDVVQAFVLNFYGRVDKPSVKNFQLVDQASDDNIYLQFGRIGEDMFNLDFQWPLSPLQAFEIAISSFDYKIACE